MADIAVNTHYEVEPNVEVQRLWLKQQIAEKEIRVKRLECDAEEILRSQIHRIEAQVIMLKREISRLYDLQDKLDQFGKDEVVDIKRIEAKGA